MGAEVAEQQVREGFAAAGLPVEILVVENGALDQALKDSVNGPHDAVILAGGDGTVRSAAALLAGSEKALGIIPMGTFNLLARDLGVPLTLPEAVAALATAEPRRIDAAELNGSMFLCVSIIGFYPYVAQKREEWRDLPAWRRYPALFVELVKSALRHASLRVNVVTSEGSTLVNTRFAAVSNNPYEDVFGLIPKRESLDSGKLAAYISTHRTRGGMAVSVLRWFLGRWREDREVTEVSSGELVITSRKGRRRIPVMIDGEVEKLPFPLRYKALPGALLALKPRPLDDA